MTLTVGRETGHWVIRLWYSGTTMNELLHPTQVAEMTLDCTETPVNAKWGDLWRAVALAVLDLSDGEAELVNGE